MTRLQAVDPSRIVAMHPVAQRLPVHAILLCRLGAGTPLQYQRDRQNAAHLRAITTLAGETPQLRRCPVQASDWDCRAHPMPPWARIAPGLSNRSAKGFGTPRRVNVNADWYHTAPDAQPLTNDVKQPCLVHRAPPVTGWLWASAEQCGPFGPVPLQNLQTYYRPLRPCA